MAGGVATGVAVGVATARDASATAVALALPSGGPAGMALAQADATKITIDNAPKAREPSLVDRLLVGMPATSPVVDGVGLRVRARP